MSLTDQITEIGRIAWSDGFMRYYYTILFMYPSPPSRHHCNYLPLSQTQQLYAANIYDIWPVNFSSFLPCTNLCNLQCNEINVILNKCKHYKRAMSYIVLYLTEILREEIRLPPRVL